MQERTAELARANVGLQAEIAERERTQRRVATQYAVTRILAESNRLAETTPKIVRAICENLGWDMGAIWEVEPHAQVLRCVGIWHAPVVVLDEFETATRQQTFPSGIGLPGRVCASGQPAWIADVVMDRNFPRAPAAAQAGLHGAFALPILCRGEVLGVMEFFSREIREPDTDLLEMFGAIGSQIGQVLGGLSHLLPFQTMPIPMQAGLPGGLVPPYVGSPLPYQPYQPIPGVTPMIA